MAVRRWILDLARLTPKPAGDFIRDARRDSMLPDAQTSTVLNLYLSGRGMRSLDALAAPHRLEPLF